MTTEERIHNQKLLIEKVGRFFDKEGHQPIAGRIIGLLIVMDKEAFTFDEICEELQISKSSASNTLKMLEIRGSIEYFTLPGERKRYFRAKTADLFSLVDHFEKRIVAFEQISGEILALKAERSTSVSKFITELLGMTAFFRSKMADLKKEYYAK